MYGCWQIGTSAGHRNEISLFSLSMKTFLSVPLCASWISAGLFKSTADYSHPATVVLNLHTSLYQVDLKPCLLIGAKTERKVEFSLFIFFKRLRDTSYFLLRIFLGNDKICVHNELGRVRTLKCVVAVLVV